MDIKQRVRELYVEKGYNCAEAAWIALNEEDLDEDLLNFGLRLAGGFGGGIGCGSTCGALAGAVLSVNRWFGREIGEERNELLPKYNKELCNWFKNKYGSQDCCDLKLENDHKPFCTQMLEELVEFVETLLDEGLEDENECSL